jgi:hypothetical protein
VNKVASTRAPLVSLAVAAVAALAAALASGCSAARSVDDGMAAESPRDPITGESTDAYDDEELCEV